MGRMIFDLTDEDRDALERLRAAFGHRSQAETLRQLVRERASEILQMAGADILPDRGRTTTFLPSPPTPKPTVTGLNAKVTRALRSVKPPPDGPLTLEIEGEVVKGVSGLQLGPTRRPYGALAKGSKK